MSNVQLHYLRLAIKHSNLEISFDHQGSLRFSTARSDEDEDVVITYEDFVAVAKILSVFES
jgi:hypothetical protein